LEFRRVLFRSRSLDGTDPKYLNSPESDLFNKSRLLYNLHRSKDAMRRIDRAILVEGYFDSIALDHAAVPGVVASMGTSLTSGQASLLRRYTTKVVIAYDGNDAAQRIADGFHLEFETVWSKVRGKAAGLVERQVVRAVPSGEKFVLTALVQGRLGRDRVEGIQEGFFSDPACRTLFSITKSA